MHVVDRQILRQPLPHEAAKHVHAGHEHDPADTGVGGGGEELAGPTDVGSHHLIDVSGRRGRKGVGLSGFVVYSGQVDDTSAAPDPLPKEVRIGDVVAVSQVQPHHRQAGHLKRVDDGATDESAMPGHQDTLARAQRLSIYSHSPSMDDPFG